MCSGHEFNFNIQKVLTRSLAFWMASIVLIAFVLNVDNLESMRIGPNENLKIFGIMINSSGKYIGVVCYCITNSVFRTTTGNILSSWIINNIQDEERDKSLLDRKFAYEITMVTTLYHWFDWYIYMNIVLSQIDMIFIEIVADVMVSFASTFYFMNIEKFKQKEGNYNDDNKETIELIGAKIT